MSRLNNLAVGAARRVSGSVLLSFIGGNVLLAIAAALGLLIPDSHAWQVLLSLLLCIGLVSGLLLWNAVAVRRLRTPNAGIPLWKGALLLGAWLLVAALLWHVAGLASTNIEVRAGYWDSQMPAGYRHVLPYARLIVLQHWAVAIAQWLLVPALLLPFAMETAAFGLRKQSMLHSCSVLLSAAHWFVALIAFGTVIWIVPTLVHWHPAHSVSGETVSAALRLSCAAALATVAALALFATDAELLSRRDTANES